MKKILLSLTALALAIPTMPAIKAKKMENAAIASGIPSSRAKQFGTLPAPTKITHQANVSEASANDEIISTPPAGTLMTLMGSSQSFYIYYDQVTQDEACGLAYEAVLTENGDVYLKNPVSMLDWNTYIKGVKTDEGIRFDFPQPVFCTAEGEETYVFHADVLELAEIQSPSNPYDYITTFIPAEDTRSILFAEDSDGTFRMQGDYMLGITYDGVWQGYGEMQLNLKPFDQQPAVAPEDIVYDYSYILADELNGWDHTVLIPIGIGRKGNDMYIKGLASGMPDAVISGSFDENTNTFTIPTDQFLGKYDNHYIFMMVGAGYSYYDDYWEEYMISFDTIDRPLVLNFDPEQNLFTPAVPEGNEYSYIIFNFGNDTAFPIEYYAVDRIYSQGAISDFAPISPNVLAISDIDYIDPEYSYSFEFEIFDTNHDGQILQSQNIFYNIYINGMLCTFTEEEYPDLAEAGYTEITDIPASLNIGSDIYASGSYHGIALKRADIETVGVRAVYIGDDVRAESEIITVTNTGEPVGGNAIGQLSGSDRSATEYFDLTGRKLSDCHSAGILIKRTIHHDGTSEIKKIMSR